jgi:hypothetical protein
MLRKMYLTSTDYLNKKSPPPLKTRVRVKRKKKQHLHPYDKWISVRDKIAESTVERKALMQAIFNFIKEVLPNATLVNTYTPKRESVELGTQNVTDQSTAPPYETPISCILIDTSDDDAGAVSEEDVRTFPKKSFGAIASPYLSLFVHKRGVLDIEYGLRKEGDNSFIGNSDVTVDTNSDLYIKDKHFRGTPGLWELLTRKSVNKKLVSADDIKRYKSILNLTRAHLEGYEP